MTNHLYYGDNLDVLRESIRDESVDLIYLDPPFNSNATLPPATSITSSGGPSRWWTPCPGTAGRRAQTAASA